MNEKDDELVSSATIVSHTKTRTVYLASAKKRKTWLWRFHDAKEFFDWSWWDSWLIWSERLRAVFSGWGCTSHLSLIFHRRLSLSLPQGPIRLWKQPIRWTPLLGGSRCKEITRSCLWALSTESHYSDATSPQSVSNHQLLVWLSNNLLRLTSKETAKVPVTGPLRGNPPVTGGFPSQRASNEERVSMGCHQVLQLGHVAQSTIVRRVSDIHPIFKWVVMTYLLSMMVHSLYIFSRLWLSHKKKHIFSGHIQSSHRSTHTNTIYPFVCEFVQ